ncbi:hypothetical protein Tco_0072614 [Tanacetum coccineum]
MMTTVNQGMSIEEIERAVAQRMANAIEAIAIYETKTNMTRTVGGSTGARCSSSSPSSSSFSTSSSSLSSSDGSLS